MRLISSWFSSVSVSEVLKALPTFARRPRGLADRGISADQFFEEVERDRADIAFAAEALGAGDPRPVIQVGVKCFGEIDGCSNRLELRLVVRRHATWVVGR
jgi:hypothetical protein